MMGLDQVGEKVRQVGPQVLRERDLQWPMEHEIVMGTVDQGYVGVLYRAGWVSGPDGVYLRLVLYRMLWPPGRVGRNGSVGKDPCWIKSRLLKSVKDLIQSSSVAANLHPDCNLLQEPKTNNSMQYPWYEKMAPRTSPVVCLWWVW